MNGFDIASYQGGLNIGSVPCDFVIIKATQGTTYVNPALRKHWRQATECGKLVGLYHYASKGGAEAEAAFFVKTVQSLGGIGRAILILDWEKDSNENYPNPDYARRFLAAVLQATGVRPFVYMSKSVCRDYDWRAVAPSFPLWAAQYKNDKPTGYQRTPWTDSKGFGAWSAALIYQYTSHGRLPGYGDDLDLDIAYLSPTEWMAYASPVKQVSYAGIVTASALRVRKSPGGEMVQVGGHDFVLPMNMVVAIDRESCGWGRVAALDAWVSIDYIKR
jgi:lysozyme